MHKATLLALATITAVLSACGTTTQPPVVTQAKVTVSVTAPAQASVTLKGEGGKTYPVSGGSVQVPPGTYTVVAAAYKQGGYTYVAPTQTVTFKAGESPRITVAYQAVTGALTLVVDDQALTPAASAQNLRAQAATVRVTVSGPDGYSKTLTQTGTYTLEDLGPGAYTVNGLYGKTLTVNVVAGQTARAKSSVITTGALDFTAELPGGITPDITLSGEGASQALGTSGAVHLTPGEYQLSARDVRANGITYVPTPATQGVTVKQAARVSAGVKYEAVTGAATVNVLALEGVRPSVTVTGPDGYTQTVKATGARTLEDLKPGEYTVTAQNVTVDSYIHVPTLTRTTFTVKAGQAEQVGVSYGVVTGNLYVRLSGLPEGRVGGVLIRNAQGFITWLSTSQGIFGLAPGEYSFQAVQIYANGEWFRAPAMNVTVVAGQTAGADVQYAQATGDITASVSGVPQGAQVKLHVTGEAPDTSTDPLLPLQGRALGRTVDRWIEPGETLRGLEPGQYTVTPQDVTVDGQRFGAEPRTVTVTPGGNATPSFAYAEETGTLQVEVGGLPGLDPQVTVDVGVQSLPLVGPSTLKGLEPGAYTVTAGAVHDLNFYYDPTVTGGAGQITAGGTATAGVAYARRAVSVTTDKTSLRLEAGVKADLTATVQGAVNEGVTWTQGGQELGKTKTLTYTAPSEPGTYTLTATSDADPSRAASVTVNVHAVQQFGTVDSERRPSLALDGQGGVHLAYISSAEMVMVRRPDGTTASYHVRTALGLDPNASLFLRDVAVDAQGQVYVVGNTNGAFGGNTNAGGDDAFLVKIDAGGNVVTKKQFGTNSGDFPNSVTVDAEGRVYVVGSTYGAFGEATNAGGADVFLTKIDPDGMVTTQQFGTAGGDTANHVAVDAEGRVYIVGSTNGAFGEATNAGGADAFLTKIDADGTVTTQQFGTAGGDTASAVTVDASGKVYIVGDTDGVFGGNTSAESGDAFLTKIGKDSSVTTQQFGTAGDDYANSVAVDAGGQVYVVGDTDGAFVGSTNTGEGDVFLAKFKP